MGRAGRLGAASGRCAVRAIGVLVGVAICARSVGPAGGVVGGRIAGVLSGVRYSVVGDAAGGGPADAGAALGGGVAGLARAGLLGRYAGWGSVSSQCEGRVRAGGVRCVEYRALPLLLAGFAIPNAFALGGLWAQGRVGRVLRAGVEMGPRICGRSVSSRILVRVWCGRAHWLGFHAALAIGALWFWWRDRKADRQRWVAWGLHFVRRRRCGMAILSSLLFPASAGGGAGGRALDW